MTHGNPNRAVKTWAQLLGIAVLIVTTNVLMNAVALPHIDLPDLSDLPDIPDWMASSPARSS
jgi:hypothetical protein